jgi:hypothetical protein
MPFTGKEGTPVSREVARTLIKKFQQSTLFQGVTSGFIGREILLSILNQPNCVGVRYYHALDTAGQPTIVIVGEDKSGALQRDGILGEEFPLCPPFCWTANGLEE